MNTFQEAVSEKVWDKSYRYRSQDKIIDETIEDTWRRVAQAVAKAEQSKNAAYWEEEFYRMLSDFRFIPGDRILAGAGTKHAVTLFDCFVMPIAEDSLLGIFEAIKEAALTLQQGGSVGYDFSSLRPRGYPVVNVGTFASGPVSFMRIWDAMCGTMASTGTRRGTMTGILRCDHPDIEEFIAAKSDPHELRHFNLSVLVSDNFMQCVKENREWELIFPAQEEDLTDAVLHHWSHSAEPVACRVIRRVNARDLWDKIIQSAFRYAEPGILFEDTVNRQNNLWYREWISTTNPYGEFPLPAYGACHVGVINLTQFINHAFESNASIDWDGIQKTVYTAMRFLDNVIDVSHYPLKMQKQEVYSTRRMGLGITGLADAFVMLGIRYGSAPSFDQAKKIMQCISDTAWQASISLAQERGVFAGFHAKKYLQGNFVQHLSEEVRQAIEKNGIRNSHHLAIGPAKKISLLANNVSNGIEPIRGADYECTLLGRNGESVKHTVTDYAMRLWRKKNSSNQLPPAWVDVFQLTPQEHLQMQSIVQFFVDNAVAKTIYLPTDFPVEELSKLYTEAHALGLKNIKIGLEPQWLF